MVDFTSKFKSFVDKAQQKVTEIQNDEKLREAVGGVVKQAQEKIEGITNDERVKGLIDQGKGKFEELRGMQSSASNAEQPQLSPVELPSSAIVDLASTSLAAQPGERKWTATMGQEFNTLFTSELGIRALSGQLPLMKNKLALPFGELTLTGFKEKGNDIAFTFLWNESSQTMSFSCINKKNHEELIKCMINQSHAVSSELEKLRDKLIRDQHEQEEKLVQAQGRRSEITAYLQAHLEQVVFKQAASYRGGLPGFPNSADRMGKAYILSDSIIFEDDQLSSQISYSRVLRAELDLFQLRGGRAILAGGRMGRMLQEVKNIVAITYVDDENNERTLKIQIHGALSIPGEGVKAQEFLNRLLDFKGSFAKSVDRASANTDDPLNSLKKLKELEELGIISKSEFETKKKELLKRL